MDSSPRDKGTKTADSPPQNCVDSKDSNGHHELGRYKIAYVMCDLVQTMAALQAV